MHDRAFAGGVVFGISVHGFPSDRVRIYLIAYIEGAGCGNAMPAFARVYPEPDRRMERINTEAAEIHGVIRRRRVGFAFGEAEESFSVVLCVSPRPPC